uniref:Serpin domain-containing protein n=1 Tax=Cuerna arida TaxID=1464854 RepID=A0A1B6FTW1_9HEMI
MYLLILACVILPLNAEDCPISVGPVSESQESALQESRLQVAVDLLRTVASQQPTKNVFLSPSSIYSALLLEFFVAAGNTEHLLRNTLHIPEKLSKSTVVGLYTREKETSKINEKQIHNAYELNSANRIYVQEDLPIRKCVKQLLRDEYNKINFKDGVAVEKINNWVAEVTRNMINPFLPEGVLNPSERIALVNAVYFKGNWKIKFDEDDTQIGEFTLADGSKEDVEMMTNTANFATYHGRKYGVLELPYEGDDITMFIVMPSQPSSKAIPQLLEILSREEVEHIITRMSKQEPNEVTISVPKFTSEHSYELAPVLKTMGAGELFDKPADLSHLFKQNSTVMLSKLFHKAKIELDEMGAKAAAATNVISNRMLSSDFNVNRPFVYFIYQKSSRTILFSGIFNSP